MVRYDLVYWPDTLGIALMVLAYGCTARFFVNSRLAWISAAGLLLGLQYGVKEYFVLPIVPLTLVLAWGVWRGQRHWTTLIWLVALFGIGLSFKPLLLWLDGQGAQSNYGSMVSYGQRLAETGAAPIVKQLVQRARYPFWILVTCGGIHGLASLCGLYSLAVEWRRGWAAAFFSGATFLLIAFLAFFPASISPWVFVNMLPRYLPVLTPSLAIGVGFIFDKWLVRIAWPSPPLCVMLATFGFAVAGFTVPDSEEAYPSFQLNEFAALDQLLKEAPSRGLSTIVFPPGYEQRLPDYFSHLPNVQVDVWSAGHGAQLDAGEALYLPRDLAEYVFSLNPQAAAPEASWTVAPEVHQDYLMQMRALVASRDCQIATVAATRSSARYWAGRVGVQVGGVKEVVGLLLFRRAETESDLSAAADGSLQVGADGGADKQQIRNED
jgi:hypothetical protein